MSALSVIVIARSPRPHSEEDEPVIDPEDEVIYTREVPAAVWHALVDLGRDVDYLEAVEDWLAHGGDEPDPVTFVRLGSHPG